MHTSLLNIMDEVYASVPISFGESYYLPAPRKLVKVEEVV